MPDAQEGQKRAADPHGGGVEEGCELPWECWE